MLRQCTKSGPKGTLEILPGQPTGSVYGQSGGGKPNLKRLFANKKEVLCENALQLRVLLDQFAHAISTRAPFKCPGEMGLRDIRIVEAIYNSAKNGGTRVAIRA